MGGYFSSQNNKLQPRGNRISSSFDLNSESIELSEIEEIKVPDVTTSHKFKSRSLLPFGKGKSFTNFRKTTSFQSPVSVNNPKNIENEVVQLKKQIESINSSHDREKEEWISEKKRMQEEVHRLRNEVKVLNTAVPKLRADKEKARKAESDALERAKAFEQEKDKIQRQFKVFREAKEKEVQTILKEKHHVINHLRKFVSSEGSVQDFLLEGADVRQHTHSITDWLLDSQSLADSYLEKKTENGLVINSNTQFLDFRMNRDISSVLQKLLSSLHHVGLGIPTGNTYSVYVTASPNMEDHAHRFEAGCMDLMLHLELKGKLLSVHNFPCQSSDKQEVEEGKLQYLKSSDICVLFAGEDIQHLNDVLTEAVHSRKIVIVVTPEHLSRSNRGLLSTFEECHHKRIHFVSNSEELHVSALAKVLEICNSFLEKQQHRENVEKEKSEEEIFRLTPKLDMLHVDEQSVLQESVRNMCALNEHMQQEIAFLNNYITQDGPLQPLLLAGDPGSGKSSLLAHWVVHLQESLQNSCILYHIASYGCSNSLDTVQLIRRFSYLLLDQVPALLESQMLEKNFQLWLDRACSKHANGVIVVIDGADLLNNGVEHLKWLLDPLPVPLRVVISVSSEDHPRQWLSWPRLHLTNRIKDIFGFFVSHFSSTDHSNEIEEVISFLSTNSELLKKAATNLLNHLYMHLALTFATRLVPNEKFKKVMQKCLMCDSIVDMYVFGIKLLQKKYNKELVMEVLVMVSASYNGLSMMELKYLTSSTSYDLSLLLHDLAFCRLLVTVCGLVQLSRSQVKDAVHVCLKEFDKSNEFLTEMRYRIIKFFAEDRSFSNRTIVELPWQLTKTDNKDKLMACIRSIRALVWFVEKGQSTRIMSYWKHLGHDISVAYEIYKEELSVMESDFNESLPIYYDILGDFMQEVSQYKSAHVCFERALELKEAHLEADSAHIGRSFFFLGRLFTQWKKFQTAENYFKQLLEIKEQNGEDDQASYAKVFESLAVLYALQEKSEDADKCKKQAYVARQNYMNNNVILAFENIVNECRGIITDLKSESWSNQELAGFLTDIGLVHFNLRQYSDAADALLQALQLFVNILGDKHPVVADQMCKLSFVYQTMNEDDKAEHLLDQALAILLQNYDPSSSQVQSALKSLVRIYRKKKKFDHIENLYRKIIQVEEHVHGERSPSVANAINVLAVHLSKRQRYKEAVELYHRSMIIYVQEFGAQDDHISEVLSNMAKLYYEQQNLRMAACLYQLSLDSSRTEEHLNSLS